MWHAANPNKPLATVRLLVGKLDRLASLPFVPSYLLTKYNIKTKFAKTNSNKSFAIRQACDSHTRALVVRRVLHTLPCIGKVTTARCGRGAAAAVSSQQSAASARVKGLEENHSWNHSEGTASITSRDSASTRGSQQTV